MPQTLHRKRSNMEYFNGNGTAATYMTVHLNIQKRIDAQGVCLDASNNFQQQTSKTMRFKQINIVYLLGN